MLPKDETNTIAVDPWIDWLELLEHFLDTPFNAISRGNAVTRSIGVPIEIPVKGDRLVSLAEKYSKSYWVPPSGPETLTWEVIADANFNTKGLKSEARNRQINLELKTTGKGYPVKDTANYAFHDGVKVIIPSQRITFKQYQMLYHEPKYWWRYVITHQEKWEVFKNFSEKGTKIAVSKPKDPKQNTIPPHQHTYLPIQRDKLDDIIEKGHEVRKEKEDAYKTVEP